MQSIKDISGLKVYYPFLIDRKSTIRRQSSDIIAYLLLADKVIIPPDHIFSEKVVRSNAEYIKSNNLIFELFRNGHIITTSTNNKIQNVDEIIYQRSKFDNIKIPDFSIPLFYRDELFQRKKYTEFYLKEFSIIKDSFYEKDKVKDFIKFVKSEPRHNEIISKISTLKFSKTDKIPLDYSRYLAKIAYLKAGADGNDAIMPTFDNENNYSFYNDYYSLKFARQFLYRMSKKLKVDLTTIKFKDFEKISKSLIPFKEEFYLKTNFLKNLEDDVYKVFVEFNKFDKYRNFKSTLNLFFGYVAGELIEDYILPKFLLGTGSEFALKIFLAYFFEKIHFFENVLKIATNFIEQNDLTFNLYSKFGELIDKFDEGIVNSK